MIRIQDDIESAYEPVTETGCWIWMRSRDPRGYGQLGVDGKITRAHRHFYATYVGPIPEEMFVLHKCDIPACVNPTHLFLGTQADNMSDMVAKGRCRAGHVNKDTGELENALKHYQSDEALAKAAGVKVGTVAVWRHRKAIPLGIQWRLQAHSGGKLKAGTK